MDNEDVRRVLEEQEGYVDSDYYEECVEAFRDLHDTEWSKVTETEKRKKVLKMYANQGGRKPKYRQRKHISRAEHEKKFYEEHEWVDRRLKLQIDELGSEWGIVMKAAVFEHDPAWCWRFDVAVKEALWSLQWDPNMPVHRAFKKEDIAPHIEVAARFHKTALADPANRISSASMMANGWYREQDTKNELWMVHADHSADDTRNLKARENFNVPPYMKEFEREWFTSGPDEIPLHKVDFKDTLQVLAENPRDRAKRMAPRITDGALLDDRPGVQKLRFGGVARGSRSGGDGDDRELVDEDGVELIDSDDEDEDRRMRNAALLQRSAGGEEEEHNSVLPAHFLRMGRTE